MIRSATMNWDSTSRPTGTERGLGAVRRSTAAPPALLVRAGLLSIAMSLAAAPASAAIRLCKPVLTGEAHDAAHEDDARRLALESWVAIAERRHGNRFTAWRLAYMKSLDCAALARGRVRCVATGSPCTISQVTPPAWQLEPDLIPVPAPRMRYR